MYKRQAQDRILQSLSYINVLKRGFALVRDETGAPVKAAAALAINQMINVTFADGSIRAITTEGGAPQPARKRSEKAVQTDPPKQGSLF